MNSFLYLRYIFFLFYSQAYDIYLKVLDLDQNNAIALRAIEDLRAKIGEQPPLNATRMKIYENSAQANKNLEVNTENHKRSNVSANTTTENRAPKPKEYDLANLIVPNRVVKNKLATAAAALGQSLGQNKPKLPERINESTTASAAPELRLPISMGNQYGKTLIEEI